jgi:hypothetical protein
MNLKHTTVKALAAVTAVGALTVGGASLASAAPGSGAGDGTAAVAERGERARPLRQGVRTAFTAAADTLGLTPQELREQMKNGPQSIATIASDKTDAVVAAIIDALNARIDEAVANGNFPADRVDQAKARVAELAPRFVNRVPGQHAQQ